MIKEDYVSFEIAKLLKEKGFDITLCNTCYKYNGKFCNNRKSMSGVDNMICYPAPTIQMAMKWMREKHCIFIATEFGWFHGDYEYQASVVKMNPTAPPTPNSIDYIKGFRNKSYEIACEESIKYCLEILL